MGITITNDNNRLTPEEIQKMIDEAEQFAEDDKLVKEHTEAKNELEQYAFSLKRQVDELKIQDDDKEAINNVVEEKLEWLNDNQEASTEEFKEAKKAIEEVAQPIIAKMYQQGQGQESKEKVKIGTNFDQTIHLLSASAVKIILDPD